MNSRGNYESRREQNRAPQKSNQPQKSNANGKRSSSSSNSNSNSCNSRHNGYSQLDYNYQRRLLYIPHPCHIPPTGGGALCYSVAPDNFRYYPCYSAPVPPAPPLQPSNCIAAKNVKNNTEYLITSQSRCNLSQPSKIRNDKEMVSNDLDKFGGENKLPGMESNADRLSSLSVNIDVSSDAKSLSSGLNKDLNSEMADVPLFAVKRPDAGGKEGFPIQLLANHFLVDFEPSQQIFHYDVEIIPQPSKEIARDLKRKLVEENSALLSDSLPAYDGRKSLYSPTRFQKDRMEFEVALPARAAKDMTCFNTRVLKSYRVIVKIASTLNGQVLEEFLKNKEDHVSLPQSFIQALDVVLRENPTEKCFPVSRSLYSSSMREEIGGGVVGLKGFFQSLRATQQGLALNVDFSVTAFHESIGIIPYLQKRCSFLGDLEQNKSRKLSEMERKEVEKTLRNMKVFVCHRATNQRYRVHGLTAKDTDVLTFKYLDGKQIKVVDYFKEHYNHSIQYLKLPCLQVSQRRPCYLPMEFCVICEGQKFLGKLSDEQKKKILNLGCRKPSERKNIIKDVVRRADGPRSGNYVKQFKIYISQEMTQLNGRILQPPMLRLGEGGEVKNLTPYSTERHWNMLKSHVVEGRAVTRWALISFSDKQHKKVKTFIKLLTGRCQQLGIRMSTNPIRDPRFEPMRVLDDPGLLEAKLRSICEGPSGNLDLLLCIMEKKHSGYADLKRICETQIGVVTQCCLSSHFNDLKSQYLANVALKINAKVGGSTVALYNTLPSQLPALFSEPAILFGADVTHPHPMDDSSPSVAAVVASMNWPAANKYVARMRTQTHRKEIIQGLRDMVLELLQDYRQEIKQLPRRILFFRDGVSEGQFYKVLEEELKAIKDACKMFDHYHPTVTFAVVQKRHHTRLFPIDAHQPQPQPQQRTVQRNSYKHRPSSYPENILPGTVVDTKITHPREFDFYLCSHAGSKGTSRPTHYHVLWDENHFKSDELQKLINSLCYTFVRCTKPISLVPPAYYAHLAAYRARLYLGKSGSVSDVFCSKSFGRSEPLFHENEQSRLCPPEVPPPLPALNENVKRLMFYC